MRRIGLLGGMSWHSTEQYYRGLNRLVAQERGGHSSAPVIIDSLDFSEIRAQQIAEDWETAGEALVASARRLAAAGAEAVAIATNLMHKVADVVEQEVDLPLIHIGDAVAQQARAQGVSTLGVLGTVPTMLDTFYREKLHSHGLRVVVPESETCALLHRRIFEELTLGTFQDPARLEFSAAMDGLRRRGAEAVVLGCTEIGILVPPETAPVPAIDSVDAHVAALAAFCLHGELPGRFPGGLPGDIRVEHPADHPVANVRTPMAR